MLKPIKYFAISVITLASISTVSAHLALDHLKEGLESRFNQVAESYQLNQEQKARALSQLRTLQSKYTTLVSLSQIPSQKQAAEHELKQLNKELQEFDKALQSIGTTRNKS